MSRYRVKAAMALVKTWTAYNPYGQGRGVAHLPQGAILPDDVAEADIQHLLDSQIVEPVEAEDPIASRPGEGG